MVDNAERATCSECPWEGDRTGLEAHRSATAHAASVKATHVLAAKQDRRHGCHWPDCDKQVPPAMWGCKTHWFKLPKRLRDAIWAAYVPGQEQRMDPSAEYLAVAREVQDWIENRD